MIIKSPLTLDENGTTIEYPGNPSEWRDTIEYQGYIVGEYVGLLYDQDGVTKLFDWENFVLPQPNLGKKITKLAFKNRFTDNELVFIELASLDDINAPLQNRQQAAMLRVFLGKVSDSTFIDLSRHETITGVSLVMNLMVGMIDGYDQNKIDQRISEILTTSVSSVEVPTQVK